MRTDFDATCRAFHPPEGIIHLDGNSLGQLPLTVKDRLAAGGGRRIGAKCRLANGGAPDGWTCRAAWATGSGG